MAAASKAEAFYTIELTAARKDLEALFKDFLDKNSWKLKDFIESWRKLEFTFIFFGKRSNQTRQNMALMLFYILSCHLTQQTDLNIRIASVFALFSVYKNQTGEPKAKIRMTPTMWKDFLKLVDLAKQLRLHDAEFVMTKLRSERAFHFTAAPKILHLGYREMMLGVEETEEQFISDFPTVSAYSKDLSENNTLVQKLLELHNEYLQSKHEVANAVDSAEDRATRKLLSSRNNIAIDVQKTLDTYRKVPQPMAEEGSSQLPSRPSIGQLPMTDGDDTMDDEGEVNESEMYGSHTERVAAIKRKSFASSKKKPRGFCRHKEVDENATEDELKAAALDRIKSRTKFRRSGTVTTPGKPTKRSYYVIK